VSFWWVNQGQSYAAERRAGILWAPVRTDAGFDLVHWSSMTKVVNGDVIFNYAAGHLRAVSVAFGPEELAVRPVDLPSQWPSEGRLVRVEMTDIVPPIPLETIPEAARLAEPKVGPFDRRGMVKQGYLFPISEGLGEDLLALVGVEMTTSQPVVDDTDSGLVLPQDPELRRMIERYAVEAVLAGLRTKYTAIQVREMPPNNPGHDIQVDRGTAGVLYIEVKGTARAAPVFLMSETERAFSELKAADYELHVVYSIDLAAKTHRVEVRSGAVTAASHGLVVQRWQGRLT
jgi:hypothetical protein